MAALFIDGFDKYGPTNMSLGGLGFALPLEALMAGAWTSVVAPSGNVTIVPPLSAIGNAIQFTGQGYAQKTLASNLARVIGGFRFSVQSIANNPVGIAFTDGGTPQFSIAFNHAGQIAVLSGGTNGTVLGTSTASVAEGSTHYLEFDATVNNSTGSVQVWLDGASILNLTGINNRGGTSNNYTNGFTLGQAPTAGTGMLLTVDDLYIFDSTGGANNAALLTSPVVETKFPSSDVAAVFSPAASVVGNYYQLASGSLNGTGANQIMLLPVKPQVNMTINSIGVAPFSNSLTANLKPLIFADASGAPGTLLSAGAQVTGTTSGTPITAALTTPQALTAGTKYWIGIMTDSSLSWAITDNLSNGVNAAYTYTGGAPGTCPSVSTSFTWEFWGNCTSGAHNYAQEDNNPPADLLAYNSSSNVGDEDLFGYPALSSTPNSIYTVQVSGRAAKSDAGARTIDLRTKSSGTDSGGSSTGQAPATTFGWLYSQFPTDPNTSAAWTASALNAASSGYKIAS